MCYLTVGIKIFASEQLFTYLHENEINIEKSWEGKMAWCPHCESDRPIIRQSLSSSCVYCGSGKECSHGVGCRGPVAGWLNVCSYCNTPLFAQAKSSADYSLFSIAEKEEYDIRKRNQFVYAGIGILICFFFLYPSSEGREKSKSYESPRQTFEKNVEQTKTSEQQVPLIGMVDTPSGVSVREKPGIDGDKLGGLSNKTEFEILNQFGPEDVVEGKKGRWIQVKFKKGNGWVFDGFVKLKIQAEKID